MLHKLSETPTGCRGLNNSRLEIHAGNRVEGTRVKITAFGLSANIQVQLETLECHEKVLLVCSVSKTHITYSRFITQREMFQYIISCHFNDYNLQIIKK